MKLTILLITLFSSLSAFAQDSIYAVSFGLGYAYNTTQDLALSPLIYGGHNGHATIGYHDPLSSLEVAFQYGKIKTGSSPFGAKMTLMQADINYRQYIELGLPKNEKLHHQLGVGLLSHAGYRKHPNFVNNDMQFNYASSLSIESRLRIPFQVFGREMNAQMRASLPFFSLGARPGFNATTPDGYQPYQDEPVEATINSLEFFSFAKMMRFVYQTSLNYPLENGNIISLRYQWDFYRFNFNNDLTSGTHRVGIHCFLNFNQP